jgi:hypothetical protein
LGISLVARCLWTTRWFLILFGCATDKLLRGPPPHGVGGGFVGFGPGGVLGGSGSVHRSSGTQRVVVAAVRVAVAWGRVWRQVWSQWWWVR